MRPLQYTFVGDGSSDRALLPIINWLIRSQSWVHERGFVEQMADLSNEDPPLGRALEPRLRRACQLYPCDILFIHRDAERQNLEERWREIEEAAQATIEVPWVPVVPVSMTEAWILIDELAIRRAADNPSSKVELGLPTPDRLEDVADPKNTLHGALLAASEKRGRRRKSFKSSLSRRVQRVADLTDDYTLLRRLDAFRVFEERTRIVLTQVKATFEKV